MVGQSVLEAGNIVPSRAAGFVRSVKGYPDIEAENQKTEIVAQAQTCSHSDVFKSLGCERGSGTQGILAYEPDIAGIEERGSVEITEEADAEFGVGFELDVAGLVDIGVFGVGRPERAWAYGADGEGADAVGTSGIDRVRGGCFRSCR